MGREIKFRVWNENDVKMINWNQLRIEKDEREHRLSIVVFDGCVGDHYDHFPIMQYTGLKDMNGKEIYEGDIVYQEFNDPRPLEHGGFTGVVKMLEGCWVIDNQSSNAEQLWSELNENEVMGNIYENPDLLEVAE